MKNSHESPVRHGKIDSAFLWTLLALIIFGLLMLSSASGPTAYAKHGDAFFFVKHQLLYGLLPGAFLFLFFAKLDYRKLQKFAKLFFGLSLALLVVVFIPGIGATWGTARNWIYLFGFSLQPVEMVKFFFTIYMASWLAGRDDEDVHDTHRGLYPFLTTLGLVGLLLVLQPDIGGLSIIVGISIFMFFLAGASITHLLGMALSAVAGLFILIKAAPYRAARFTTFLHPELDPQGIGYHINQALMAIGSGGWFGLGFGHSRQKFLYLPEVEGDSIFAIIGEELGFVFVAAFLFLLIFFIFRGFRIAKNAPDRFGKILGAGMMCWIMIQSFVNMAAMLSLMPLTGVTLPFVSYGGTSLLMLLAAMGVVASISRQSTA